MADASNNVTGPSALGSFGTPSIQGIRTAIVQSGNVVGYTEMVTFSQATVINQAAHAAFSTAADPTPRVTYVLNYGLDG